MAMYSSIIVDSWAIECNANERVTHGKYEFTYIFYLYATISHAVTSYTEQKYIYSMVYNVVVVVVGNVIEKSPWIFSNARYFHMCDVFLASARFHIHIFCSCMESVCHLLRSTYRCCEKYLSEYYFIYFFPYFVAYHFAKMNSVILKIFRKELKAQIIIV